MVLPQHQITLTQYNGIKAKLESEIEFYRTLLKDKKKRNNPDNLRGRIDGLETAVYIVQCHVDEVNRNT